MNNISLFPTRDQLEIIDLCKKLNYNYVIKNGHVVDDIGKSFDLIALRAIYSAERIDWWF